MFLCRCRLAFVDIEVVLQHMTRPLFQKRKGLVKNQTFGLRALSIFRGRYPHLRDRICVSDVHEKVEISWDHASSSEVNT